MHKKSENPSQRFGLRVFTAKCRLPTRKVLKLPQRRAFVSSQNLLRTRTMGKTPPVRYGYAYTWIRGVAQWIYKDYDYWCGC